MRIVLLILFVIISIYSVIGTFTNFDIQISAEKIIAGTILLGTITAWILRTISLKNKIHTD